MVESYLWWPIFLDREMTIERVRLEQKSGGRSGDFRRDAVNDPPGPSSDT